MQGYERICSESGTFGEECLKSTLTVGTPPTDFWPDFTRSAASHPRHQRGRERAAHRQLKAGRAGGTPLAPSTCNEL